MAFEIVVVGASTGGLKALQIVLSGLPSDFSLPIVIVQHRGKDMETGLCELSRSQQSFARDRAGRQGDDFARPRVFGAKDYHLLIEDGCFAFQLTTP